MKAITVALKVLKNMGEYPERVEKYTTYSGRSNDLWGFIDIVSAGPEGLRFIQTWSERTGGGKRAEHIQKVLTDDTARRVMYVLTSIPGVSVEFWGLKESPRLGRYFLVAVMGPRGVISHRYRLTMDGERQEVKGGLR